MALDQVNRCPAVGLVYVALAGVSDDPVVGGPQTPAEFSAGVLIDIERHFVTFLRRERAIVLDTRRNGFILGVHRYGPPLGGRC